MYAKELSKMAKELDLVKNVFYYEDDKVWILVDDVEDLLYCEKLPMSENVNCRVVDDSKRLPVSANEA